MGEKQTRNFSSSFSVHFLCSFTPGSSGLVLKYHRISHLAETKTNSLNQACLTQGVIIGWTVFIGVVLAIVFLGPPLWFQEDQTGYLYTGAFIGSMLGLVLAGVLTDSTNKVMIRLNHGKYEPEFRILLVFFQLIFSGIGLYGFGWTANDVEKYNWLLPDVFFAFLIIGMVMGAVASSLYIVDAHSELIIYCYALAAADCFRGNCRRSIHLLACFQKHVQLRVDILCLHLVCSCRH